ncbi:MAG: hypothetical protein AAFY83_06335, partial [Pseudomonadota bacterium]
MPQIFFHRWLISIIRKRIKLKGVCISRRHVPLCLLGAMLIFYGPAAVAQATSVPSRACQRLLQFNAVQDHRDTQLVERCVKDLPTLNRSAQDNFSDQYLRGGFRFLTPESRAFLTANLVPEASLKIASAGAWDDATRNKGGTRQFIETLSARPEMAKDPSSQASLEFAKAQLAMHKRDFELMGALLNSATELATQNELTGLIPRIIAARSLHAERSGDMLTALAQSSDAFDRNWNMKAFARASRDCIRVGLLLAEVPGMSAAAI